MMRKSNNLLIISSELENAFDAITSNLLPNTDILFMQQDNIISSLSIGLKDYIWDNVGILLHGKKDEEYNIIEIFSLKICCEPSLHDIDYGAIQFLDLMKLLRPHCGGALHIFACNVGSSNGFKLLIAKADEQLKFKYGISVSTDIIGNRSDGTSDWKLDWNTINGFAMDTTVPEIRQYLSSTAGLDLILESFLATIANIIIDCLGSIQKAGSNATFLSSLPDEANPKEQCNFRKYLFALGPVLISNVYSCDTNGKITNPLSRFNVLDYGAYIPNTILYVVFEDTLTNDILFVFRGTATTSDVVTDLFNSTTKIESTSLTSNTNVRINDGVENIFNKLQNVSAFNPRSISEVMKKAIDSKPRRIICYGHSLGAGFSALASGFLLQMTTIPVDLVNYAPLKVGNNSFNNFLTTAIKKNKGHFLSFRIFEDIIPKISLDMNLSNANEIRTIDNKYQFLGATSSVKSLSNNKVNGKTGIFIKSDLSIPFCNNDCINLAVLTQDRSSSETIFNFNGSVNYTFLSTILLKYENLWKNHTIYQFMPASISNNGYPSSYSMFISELNKTNNVFTFV